MYKRSKPAKAYKEYSLDLMNSFGTKKVEQDKHKVHWSLRNMVRTIRVLYVRSQGKERTPVGKLKPAGWPPFQTKHCNKKGASLGDRLTSKRQKSKLVVQTFGATARHKESRWPEIWELYTTLKCGWSRCLERFQKLGKESIVSLWKAYGAHISPTYFLCKSRIK